MIWLPIETAPDELKDGREVLLGNANGGGRCICFWVEATAQWEDFYDSEVSFVIGEPTHYQLLEPLPPEEG